MKIWKRLELTFATTALIAGTALAHGGTYRGPGDTVPSAGGGSTGGGTGPAQPGTPQPVGPAHPGAVTPGAQPGGAAGVPGIGGPYTGGGGDAGSDLTRWEYWWELNKEPYLNLRAHLYASAVLTGSDEFYLGDGEQRQSLDDRRPTRQQIDDVVVPSLLAALERSTDNDILSGAMLALAKVGDRRDEAGASSISRAMARQLTSSNQEVAESAALALGLSGNEANLESLIALLENDRAALARAGVALKGDVPERTRAFAASGLALLGRGASLATRQRIVDTFLATLERAALDQRRRDVPVACILGLGLVPLPSDPTFVATTQRERRAGDVVDSNEGVALWLADYFDDQRNAALIRAHAPRSMARLVATLPSRHWLKQHVADTLVVPLGEFSDESDWVRQACAMALGQIGDADLDPLDVRIRGTLQAVRERVEDHQTRFFAMIALAQASGRRGGLGSDGYAAFEGKRTPRHYLLARLAQGKSNERAWAAIALGVLEHAVADGRGPLSSDVNAALRDYVDRSASPEEVAAGAIALGLARDEGASELLLHRLATVKDPDACGYVALALGLLGERAAIEPIQRLLQRSKYSPALLRQAAIALGLLGDHEVVPALVDMLRATPSASSLAALSSALGVIGDRRSIEPLRALLDDEQQLARPRAFAAAALGLVADKEGLPWRASFSVDLDYRANTESLTSPEAGTGILDIL